MGLYDVYPREYPLLSYVPFILLLVFSVPSVCDSRSELVLVMEYMSGGDLFSFIMKHREDGRDISEKVRLF